VSPFARSSFREGFARAYFDPDECQTLKPTVIAEFRKADECLPESAKASGYITLSRVLGRGWSKGQVEAILGEPDALPRNPHYRKAAPMRLYTKVRVLQAEEQGRVLLRPRSTKITPVG
jgi:hypothetical protein